MRRIIIGLQVLLLYASWGAAAAPADKSEAGPRETLVEAANGCLRVDGVISEIAVNRVKDLGRKLPKCLIIRSAGGGALLSMELGEIVYTHQMDVTIWDYCMSGCANYVFPAGRKKIIPKDAVLSVHASVVGGFFALNAAKEAGALPQPLPPPTIFEDIAKEVERERQFAKGIGIPYEFYSEMPDERSMQLQRTRQNIFESDGHHSMFSIRGDHLRRCFGMTQVEDRRSLQQFEKVNREVGSEFNVLVYTDPSAFNWCPKK